MPHAEATAEVSTPVLHMWNICANQLAVSQPRDNERQCHKTHKVGNLLTSLALDVMVPQERLWGLGSQDQGRGVGTPARCGSQPAAEVRKLGPLELRWASGTPRCEGRLHPVGPVCVSGSRSRRAPANPRTHSCLPAHMETPSYVPEGILNPRIKSEAPWVSCRK